MKLCTWTRTIHTFVSYIVLVLMTYIINNTCSCSLLFLLCFISLLIDWFDLFLLIYRNPYQVLKVPRDAEKKEIKDAYRKLSKRYHPDGVRFREVLPGKWWVQFFVGRNGQIVRMHVCLCRCMSLYWASKIEKEKILSKVVRFRWCSLSSIMGFSSFLFLVRFNLVPITVIITMMFEMSGSEYYYHMKFCLIREVGSGIIDTNL